MLIISQAFGVMTDKVCLHGYEEELQIHAVLIRLQENQY